MRAIYFIEIDGEKYYKCDTFWSKSRDKKHAKIHNDEQYDQDRFFTSLIGGFKPYNTSELSDDEFQKMKRYEGGLYGYQTILDEPTKETAWSLLEESKLSDPIYLRQITSISKEGKTDSIDYKVVNRDIKIDNIINENTIVESNI